LAAERFEDEPAGEGVVIAGRYELGSQLGIGGMGVVWRGRDRRLARAVAVKVLSQSSVGSEVARTRLIREARAAAALEHEGIIRVYDVGETDDGGAFLVMELIRGRSLRCVLELGSMKLGSRVAVIVQAARALHFAHEAGIVHRDVKPDNIMIREDGRVTVVDFGVAKPLSAELAVIAGTVAGTPPGATLTGPGQLVGTPAYLAPEQARGLDVSAATDQFALAVTAFEALTDKRPWTGSCFSEVIASLLRDAPLTISKAGPVPRELDAVFHCALAKEPSDRFVDIGAFADALEDAAVSLEVDAPTSLRPNSRRLTPISLREPPVAPAPESAVKPSEKNEAITSTLISSTDAKSAEPPSAAPAKRTAGTTRRSRYVLAAALGLAIVGAVAWSLGHTKETVGATTPVLSAIPLTPSVGVATQARSTTTQEPPVASTMTTTIAPTVTPATATAEPPAKSATAEPTSASRSVPPQPNKERKSGVAAPSPSVSVAPLNASGVATPAPTATDVVPAPKSTGRRVRTEL
jgi:serine/threonine protein kinase